MTFSPFFKSASKASQLAFVGSCMLTGTVIWAVHYWQSVDAETRRQGIERDDAKRRKWRENELDHRLQQRLKEEYSKEQTLLPVQSSS